MCAKPPNLAPEDNACIAFGDNEPKLVPEMFKTETEYAFGPDPTKTRKSSSVIFDGLIEWFSHVKSLEY